MNFDRILTSVPVNRAAAIAAGGANTPDMPITQLQRREDLIRLVQRVDEELRRLSTTSDKAGRKVLGLRKQEVQRALQALPRKCVSHRDLAGYILDVMRERMTRAAYHSAVEEAQRRLKADLASDAASPQPQPR